MLVKSDLKIALLQQELVWENSEANLDHFEKVIIGLPKDTDIIVLPEMFSTGFSMQAELYAEAMDGSAVNCMRKWAESSGAAVCGSLMIREGDRFYNRFIWFEPNGTLYFYDKRHLFRMGDEQKHYSKGNSRIIISYKGWRIAPFVCYDLRFPVWLRKSNNFEYDLLLLVANWPERRSAHWKALCLARSIENQSYFIAVNRVGKDGNGVYHSGDSMCISPLGEVLYSCADKEDVGIVNISLDLITNYRQNFPVGLDADNFEILD